MELQEHKFKVIGTRPIRHDGVDKVTGRAKYGADIYLPGMLHAQGATQSTRACAHQVSSTPRRRWRCQA